MQLTVVLMPKRDALAAAAEAVGDPASPLAELKAQLMPADAALLSVKIGQYRMNPNNYSYLLAHSGCTSCRFHTQREPRRQEHSSRRCRKTSREDPRLRADSLFGLPPRRCLLRQRGLVGQFARAAMRGSGRAEPIQQWLRHLRLGHLLCRVDKRVPRLGSIDVGLGEVAQSRFERSSSFARAIRRSRLASANSLPVSGASSLATSTKHTPGKWSNFDNCVEEIDREIERLTHELRVDPNGKFPRFCHKLQIADQRALCELIVSRLDPPPLNWSILKYVFGRRRRTQC
jgi:hypothetical protein